ncbi:MAG: hypothetical protein ACI8XC_001746 [Gammaproteobacteria bacterium]|jgi:hypothetical protein
MSEESNAQIRRLLQEFEHKVVDINKRKIREIAGEINEDDFLKMAELIAVCRARYLKAVLQISSTGEEFLDDHINDSLQQHRRSYLEAMQGFNALRHALERGYVVLNTDQ